MYIILWFDHILLNSAKTAAHIPLLKEKIASVAWPVFKKENENIFY